MVAPFTKLTMKKTVILTKKIDQLISVIGIIMNSVKWINNEERFALNEE